MEYPISVILKGLFLWGSRGTVGIAFSVVSNVALLFAIEGLLFGKYVTSLKFALPLVALLYYTFFRLGCLILWVMLAEKLPFEPVSVNFHFTRKCNVECGFCFHTEKTSHVESLSNIKRALSKLKCAGMKKINFAGGEPLLYPKLLTDMIIYCKKDLALESVSIVTNGSKLTERFMARTADYIDIIAISCDSFDEAVNVKIGRGSGAHLKDVHEVARLCRKYNVKFKINTVVNRYNVHEDMNDRIRALQPFRWKVFQVLIVDGENDSRATIRDAHRFCVSDEDFSDFVDRHDTIESFVPESNAVMKSSYLLLDEHLRFLNKGTGEPTASIIDVPVATALNGVYWDKESFHHRGGIYDWKKEGDGGCASEKDPALEF